MPELKLHFPQTTIPLEEIIHRLKLARLYVNLTHTAHSIVFPGRKGATELELLLVLLCVFIGDAEGRPTTATKISAHAHLARATTYRRLDDLIRLKKVKKSGRTYHLAPNSLTPDENKRLQRVVRQYLTA